MSIFKEPRTETELDKAVIGFGRNQWVIMDWAGTAICNEIENLGNDPCELDILGGNSPEEGVWLWTGRFEYHCDYDGEWDYTVRTSSWKELTDKEAVAVCKGESILNSRSCRQALGY